MQNTKDEVRRAIVLFRNDLRIKDHEPLFEASANHDEIIPVYIFDREFLEGSQYNSARIDLHRLKFILEALNDLKESLQKAGGNLHVLVGNPITEIQGLVKRYNPLSIYYHKETGTEEIKFEESIQEAIPESVKMIGFWNKTLFHIDDLPFEIKGLPEVFTTFKKLCEKKCSIRKLVAPPANIVVPDDLNGEVPTLLQLGFDDKIESSSTAFSMEGGETAGLRRLMQYVWESRQILNYINTRNELLGENYSSKISAYLANGCISPRSIYTEVRKFEKQVISNDSTYWFIYELMWRDFFQFVAIKHRERLFLKTGINGTRVDVKRDNAKVKAWKKGETGIPFIDANMRELNATGYMSNRGRQNVAAFFVHDMKQDWRQGAAYFEQKLIDYDVASNWGNWAYLAGVGNDPRKDRYFNIVKQAKKYDAEGEFVKRWLPELKELDGDDIHEPWNLSDKTLLINKLEDTVYARPVCVSSRWNLNLSD